MDDQAKVPSGKPGRKDFKRISISLGLIALQRLSDPEVRAQLAKHGRSLSEQASQWRAERAAQRSLASPGSVEPRPVSWTDRFGRGKLERRVERLRASVLSLGEGRPELARSLDPVLAALEEVSSAIEVAEVLPLAKRVRAHQKVDRVLDDLEAGLFDAALPQIPR
ncbi:hypothetical protein ACE2AJ_13925 [Aquihabitans daechungensis]|uniref:hypothetical protein n=1 Tax=Aquihabitans daechungensis TaxID=1052257 RepID=UPI003B9FCEED